MTAKKTARMRILLALLALLAVAPPAPAEEPPLAIVCVSSPRVPRQTVLRDQLLARVTALRDACGIVPARLAILTVSFDDPTQRRWCERLGIHADDLPVVDVLRVSPGERDLVGTPLLRVSQMRNPRATSLRSVACAAAEMRLDVGAKLSRDLALVEIVDRMVREVALAQRRVAVECLDDDAIATSATEALESLAEAESYTVVGGADRKLPWARPHVTLVAERRGNVVAASLLSEVTGEVLSRQAEMIRR